MADPADLKSLLSRLAAYGLENERRWGRMTNHGMLCHLLDSFLGVMGERPIASATTLMGRTVMKLGALYFPAPWPKGVPTRPEVDQEKGGRRPGEFAKDKAQLIAVAEQFAKGDWTGKVHPIFGLMSNAQWKRWGYLHIDHHLRQFGG